jgi:hypothetical protein
MRTHLAALLIALSGLAVSATASHATPLSNVTRADITSAPAQAAETVHYRRHYRGHSYRYSYAPFGFRDYYGYRPYYRPYFARPYSGVSFYIGPRYRYH